MKKANEEANRLGIDEPDLKMPDDHNEVIKMINQLPENQMAVKILQDEGGYLQPVTLAVLQLVVEYLMETERDDSPVLVMALSMLPPRGNQVQTWEILKKITPDGISEEEDAILVVEGDSLQEAGARIAERIQEYLMFLTM